MYQGPIKPHAFKNHGTRFCCRCTHHLPIALIDLKRSYCDACADPQGYGTRLAQDMAQAKARCAAAYGHEEPSQPDLFD